MGYQNISAAIAAADKTTKQTAILRIKSKLPFLINLSFDERINIQNVY
jgi:hypothetical protein